MLKGYQDGFEDIKYTANVWLPGSSPEGVLDGSVRTYGTWTGKNVATRDNSSFNQGFKSNEILSRSSYSKHEFNVWIKRD